MARALIESIADDLDGTPITSDEEGRSLRFTLDRVTYEIDLTHAHIGELETALQPFIAVARKQRVASSRQSRRPHRDKEQLDAIRRWAREAGYEVFDHGRIPQLIEDAYFKTH
ncbi:MAG: Lsr2 family protein [Kocuria sp.]|nr:Lsr2 family protein [Kocuria sp.]